MANRSECPFTPDVVSELPFILHTIAWAISTPGARLANFSIETNIGIGLYRPDIIGFADNLSTPYCTAPAPDSTAMGQRIQNL